MQRYFMENLDLFTAENRMMQIPQTVTEVLQTYYRQPSMDFHTDLSAAIQASLVVCKSMRFWCSRNRHFREVFQMVAVIPAYEPDAVLTDLV